MRQHQQHAMGRLRDHLELSVPKFAEETGISHRSVYSIEYGEVDCGAVIWRKVRERWGKDLSKLGMTAEDFLG